MKKMVIFVLSVCVVLLSSCNKIEDKDIVSSSASTTVNISSMSVNDIVSSQVSSQTPSKTVSSKNSIKPQESQNDINKEILEIEKQRLEFEKKLEERNLQIEAKKKQIEQEMKSYEMLEKQYEQDIQEIKDNISRLDELIPLANSELMDLRDKRASLSNRIGAHTSAMDVLDEQIENKTNEIAQMEKLRTEGYDLISALRSEFSKVTSSHMDKLATLQDELIDITNAPIE